MSPRTALLLTLIILGLDGFIIALTYSLKLIAVRRGRRKKKVGELLATQIAREEINLESINPEELRDLFIRLKGELQIQASKERFINQLLLNSRLKGKYLKMLKSRFFVTRAEASFKLKFLESREIQEALLSALAKERHPVVILYLSNALAAQKVSKAIDPIVRKLRRMNPWFAQRIRAVLYTFGKDLLRYAKFRTSNSRVYMQLLICGFALDYPAEDFRQCLIERAQSTRRSVRNLALKALLKHFPEELQKEPFISVTHRQTLSYVIQAYGKTQEKEYIQKILSFSNYTSLHQYIVLVLSRMAFQNYEILSEVLDLFEHCSQKTKRKLLAKVLANRIEYYLTRINTPLQEQVVTLISELVEANHISAILLFLNQNRNLEIEAIIIKTLKNLLNRNKKLKSEMRLYLVPEVLKKLNLGESTKPKKSPPPHTEKPQRMQLALILIAILVFTPAAIFVGEFTVLISMEWKEIARLYVVRFNYLLVFYSLAINSIYLLVLGFSTYAAKVQARLSSIKDKQLLCTRHLLPSVSVIAPAYNEMANIIESTNSLLNQRYPDFELIVINDGSKDDTLNTMISYYKLEKQDMFVNFRLNTRTLRGIYTNRNIPNLIVVDKMNGGKADSLNMGLNISSKEFFCGIDADSLLEPESLLQAVSVMIDSPEESVAAGGNIYPVNGCTVEHGSLEKIALPKKFLPRLQSLEYLRAFMSGRVGWAYINTLLIISGAFGIFERERIIKTGGYLTKSGKYHKDTVGEDMELVVRISRQMREAKIPYSVDYAFNSNCWTEVPETWKALHRQRDRWHRGLIDIILFHRRLIANPKYG
ncbi:MAG: glycosyltransferase family 2 protein, partial [Bacteroidales bacterium]|nr:glycosyltransferase family 2 protein [Bacteroidales bacterium]